MAGDYIVKDISLAGFGRKELDIAETDEAKARDSVDSMCRKLLANTVIEDYRIDLDT